MLFKNAFSIPENVTDCATTQAVSRGPPPLRYGFDTKPILVGFIAENVNWGLVYLDFSVSVHFQFYRIYISFIYRQSDTILVIGRPKVLLPLSLSLSPSPLSLSLSLARLSEFSKTLEQQ